MILLVKTTLYFYYLCSQSLNKSKQKKLLFKILSASPMFLNCSYFLAFLSLIVLIKLFLYKNKSVCSEDESFSSFLLSFSIHKIHFLEHKRIFLLHMTNHNFYYCFKKRKNYTQFLCQGNNGPKYFFQLFPLNTQILQLS